MTTTREHGSVVPAEFVPGVPEKAALTPLPGCGYGLQWDRLFNGKYRQSIKREIFTRLVFMLCNRSRRFFLSHERLAVFFLQRV